MKVVYFSKALCTFAMLGLLVFWALAWRSGPAAAQPGGSAETAFAQREDAHRANNLGAARLEQFNHAEAAKEFRRALQIDPELKIARVNLAIALFNAQDLEAARAEAERVLATSPETSQAHYILGLIARNQNRVEDSISHFRRVLAADPDDVGANVNLGQVFVQQRQYAEAVPHFRRAYAAEPYNSTAIYNLATALLRTEARDEGQRLMQQFQALRQSGAATSIGQNYLEQGRYAEAVVSTGAEAELVEWAGAEPVLEQVNVGLPPAAAPRRTGGRAAAIPAAALFDYDSDGDLDLVRSGGNGRAELFRNMGGRFVNATAASGALRSLNTTGSSGIIAGDVDNDQFEDLVFLGRSGPSLLLGNGKGSFRDNTVKAKLTGYAGTFGSGALADVDHDGDLDIFLSGSPGAAGAGRRRTANKLIRNNGDGTFTDISEAAKIGLGGDAVAVIPTDFDNRRDMDILVVNFEGQPTLFQNLRNGEFRDVAAEVGLSRSGKWTAAAAGDLSKDGFIDLLLTRGDGPGVLAISDGRGKFTLSDGPAGTEGAAAAQFIDLDNDGLLDLAAVAGNGVVTHRNLGGRFAEASYAKIPRGSLTSGPVKLLSGDLDGDGDIDLLAVEADGGVRYLRNSGGERNRSVSVDLKGRVSNRTGIGAKIDMRSGSLVQKLESYAASPMPAPSQVHFGLGRRERPDAVRVIWPSGVVQAEVQFPTASDGQVAARRLSLEELDRKPSSCPYLYTWNGEKFEFVTDFLGGGEMGNWKAHGVYHYPDADEYVRIPSEKLRPKNGKYELRVTNELEEVLFLDHLRLFAVEHDAATEVYPNEGFGIPTSGKTIIYTTQNERPPTAAVDSDGRDVLPQIAELDRQFYDSFKHLNIRGYAEPHTLTLELGSGAAAGERTLLLLTGWTDYAFSSDNLAASQSGKALFFPKLQVRDRDGEWRTVIESIGISVGRPQTVVVDLTGKFLSDSREVRIVTNVKTYWDKIAVDTPAPLEVRTAEVRTTLAELRERGFSEERSYRGMVVPDYEKVVNDGRWKYFSGSFTRAGDVGPLLDAADDVFVISKTGDELVLTFDALPEPPPGRKYTFLLYSRGYSKEMDINSGSPDVVLPLPFKGMTKYPYDASETFPMTEEKRRIYEHYTTRRTNALLPRIESFLLK